MAKKSPYDHLGLKRDDPWGVYWDGKDEWGLEWVGEVDRGECIGYDIFVVWEKGDRLYWGTHKDVIYCALFIDVTIDDLEHHTNPEHVITQLQKWVKQNPLYTKHQTEQLIKTLRAWTPKAGV